MAVISRSNREEAYPYGISINARPKEAASTYAFAAVNCGPKHPRWETATEQVGHRAAGILDRKMLF